MIQSSRAFRVFVSSTFSDLKAERNALQERVFPELRKLCEQHGCRFQAIDLRWGVSEESALDQQAMRICIEEVDRCQKLSPRPNFIILLGDRYGWQPLPYEILATEYDGLNQHIDPDEKTLLKKWYRLDENAVPPVYDLLPRKNEYEDFSAWEPIERELLRTLRKGIEKVNLSEKIRLKYWSSATEQEIYKGALEEPAASEHVFCFLRKINGLPLDNTAKDFIDLGKNGWQDTEAHERLDRLKERLRNGLPGNVHEYSDCQWTGSGITNTHIDKLCEDIYGELSGIITQEISTLQEIDPLDQEIADHKIFAEERARHFTGRTEIQEKILAYINSNARGPLAIFGEGGSGKSALMAYVAKRISDNSPDAIFVSRFIGSTPSSSNIFSLLESLCKEIAVKFGADTFTPTDYKELVEDFKKKLEFATGENPLIIMLDALDQLSDAENARSLQWLPIELPEQVKLIVSLLDPSECCDQLKRRFPEEQFVPLGRMEQQEGEALIDLWLKEAKRTLQQTQKQGVLSKFRQCGLPLYLKLAFDEARKWKSYGPAEITSSKIQEIVMEYLGNLSAESRHGAVLVKHALGYLAAGKNGLTEEEILDLLSLDQEVKEAFWERSPNSPKTDRLPVVVWSRLYLDLRPYLTERIADQTSVMTFFHRQFGEVVKNNFLDAETNKKLHRRIAGYFGDQPYQYVSDGNKVPHYRKASELAYQMMQGEMWEELKKTLTDFDFPMAKSLAGMVDELVADYQKAITFPVPNKETMRIWPAFFRERAHILRRGNKDWPADKILLQLAAEHADDSPVTRGAEQYLSEGKCNWIWLRREQLVKLSGVDPCRAVLEGHTDCVKGALKLSDGRILSWSQDKTLRLWDREGQPLVVLEGHKDWVMGAIELCDGRILSCGFKGDKTLRLWDRDGRPLTVLEGHKDCVLGARELGDGRILSWSWDDTLRLWDREGQLMNVLEGHTKGVYGAIELGDGRILSWSGDDTLRLWDREGQPLVVLKGHADSVRGALDLSDGNILSWSVDGTLRLWDRVGQLLTVLEGHTERVYGAIELSDGRILSWSMDNTMWLWDRDGQPMNIIEGHTRLIDGVIELCDGRILSWSFDKTLRLWDREGQLMNVLEGHTGGVDGAIELSDGCILSWSMDNTMWLWDREGQPLVVLKGHADSVRGALDLSDGNILSWSVDGTLRLWDRDGRPLNGLKGHTRSVDGAIELSDGRILSWSRDSTLRLWDWEGQSLTVLAGNTGGVYGAIELGDGSILSWSWDDKTLRLWDREGQLLTLLDGHTKCVMGAIELGDGRILSCGDRGDNTLRLWDRDGRPLTVLEGHKDRVLGARELGDGRILSWSWDDTLRLWDREGRPMNVLEGHTQWVYGAIELGDGRILSWSGDDTLRLWDREGQPLVVLTGHKGLLYWEYGEGEGAIALDDGRILSWSWKDKSMRFWKLDGEPFGVYGILEGLRLYPEVRKAVIGKERVVSHTCLDGSDNSSFLRIFGNHTDSFIVWHGVSKCMPRLLKSDGRAVVTQKNGQVCFLKIYHGNHSISLDDLEQILASKGQISDT